MCVCVCVCVCARVCLSVRSFLPPRASRPRNVGTYVFTASGKIVIFAKMLGSEATASLNFACLRCHQLHLNPKRRIPKESAEGWKAIDSRDFN